MTKEEKVCELDATLRLIIADLTKAKICKKLNIKPTALANRLRRLEEMGCIERQGKYIIKVLRSSLNHPRVTINQLNKKFNKRGHAHNFTIIFPEEKVNLNEKPEVLKLFNKRDKDKPEKRWLTKLPFGSLKFQYKRNTIWINTKSVTVYSNNSYYSDDALMSKFRALKEVDAIAKYLKRKFGFRGIYGIEVFREHYGLIFNKFAEWILSKGRKLTVKNMKNKTILWVDDSKKDDVGLKEFEGEDPVTVNSADKLFDSHERTGFKVTPEHNLKHQAETNKQIKELAKQSNKNAKNLDYHAENMRSHITVVKRIGKGVDKQNELFNRMVNVLEKMENKQ